MNKTIYAIGDIHGELDMLKEALTKIEQDGGPNARVIFVGDYVDRGPNSKGVIQFLIDGLANGKNWVCLLGNHDRMFSYFMEETPRSDLRLRIRFTWLHDRLGGKDTLASYGINVEDDDSLLSVHSRARAAVPESHLEFLQSRPYFHQENQLLFVHAGIRPDVPFEQQDKEDLLWIRQEFHEDTRQYPWLVVHGHTPVSEARHYGNRVNLDTGSGYGEQLSTAAFEGENCWLLTDAGRSALLPQPLD